MVRSVLSASLLSFCTCPQTLYSDRTGNTLSEAVGLARRKRDLPHTCAAGSHELCPKVESRRSYCRCGNCSTCGRAELKFLSAGCSLCSLARMCLHCPHRRPSRQPKAHSQVMFGSAAFAAQAARPCTCLIPLPALHRCLRHGQCR